MDIARARQQLEKLLDDLQTIERRAQRRDDPEDWHKLRTTSRRVRGALQVFETLFPAAARPTLARKAKAITRRPGEVRDLETIRTAITAAETGHLVFASVHAGDCVGAIDRLVSVFPADEQRMIQRLLSLVLRGVVAQHLLVPGSAAAGGPPEAAERPRRRVLASELLLANSAVANLIAQGNTKQVYSVLETGAAEGMHTLDASLARLFRQRLIDETTVRSLARNPSLALERRQPLPAGA